MSVKVAKEGNQRVGVATNDELIQCVIDIKSWFQRNGLKDLDTADSANIQRLEKVIDNIPIGLIVLLREANGGLWFGEKVSLSVKVIPKEIIHSLQNLEANKLWNDNLVPFACESSCYLAINKKSGSVVEWDEEDGINETLSDSFNEYVENYRNSLLEGKYEYLDSVGVIEKISGSRK